MTTGTDIGIIAKVFGPILKIFRFFTKKIYHEEALWNRKAIPFCSTPQCGNKLLIKKCEIGYINGVFLYCKKCAWSRKIPNKKVDQLKREAYGRFQEKI